MQQLAFNAFDTGQQSTIFELLQAALAARILQSISYYDGEGELLQRKLKAENGSDCYLYNADTGTVTENDTGLSVSNRWLTSGQTVYNNKGEVVRQYEPYYIDTTQYVEDDALSSVGASPINYYDPLGRATHAITEKGFLLWTRWSAWEVQAWDANDAFLLVLLRSQREQHLVR